MVGSTLNLFSIHVSQKFYSICCCVFCDKKGNPIFSYMYKYLVSGVLDNHIASLELIAVKCNLTKLTTKRSWYLSSGQRFAVGRAGSVPPQRCSVFQRGVSKRFL